MKKILQSIVLLLGVLMFPAVAYAQQTLYGDVNGDLEVNIADINSVIDIILDGTAITPTADVNGDGEVNIADINVIIDIILGGGAHLSWYLVADQERPIAMSRVAVLTAGDKYTETFKVLDIDGNVLADQVKKVTFEFLDDAVVAHESNNHNTKVRVPGQDDTPIPFYKFLLSYQQDNQIFHESPEIITFQNDGNGHYSWNSSTSTAYNSAHDISYLDYVARSATSSVKLPDDAPVSPDDIYISGNDGYVIDVQQDGTFTTIADYLVAMDQKGNTLYLAYANSGVNDNMQVVTMDSRETALALVLPILPNIYEAMPQEHLNKLKEIFWDVPEVKALAQAIDESIVSKGYLDMDYVDNAYQTAYNRLVVLLHLDTTYLSDASTQMLGSGVVAPLCANATTGELAPETAPQQAPQTPFVVYPYNKGIQLLLNDARYLIVEATLPVDDVMTASKYIWQCDFELRNSNSFAYTSIMQGRLGPGGDRFDFVYDEPYEIAIFLNILKAQKVSSFLDTFTSLDGVIEDLGNWIEDTWKLLSDSEYFFDEMTWDQEIKQVTFNMSTYDDIVAVVGPGDNNYVLGYNILKVAVEPILKMVAKKLLKGKGETYFEEKILIPFLTDFFFKTLTDAELKAKFESIIYNQSLSNATKVMNLADLLAPKLFDFVLKEVYKIEDKEGKDAIQEMFTNMAKQFDKENDDSQGDFYDNVLIAEGELENLSFEELWSEVKMVYKWLNIIEKVGDATTGFLGLFEHNRTYEINLDFGDQLVLSDYTVVMPPNEKIVHIEMGKRVYDLENDNPALVSVEKSPGIKGTYLKITRNDINLTGNATITVTDRLLNKQAFIHVSVGLSNAPLYIEQQSLDLGEVPIGQTRTGELTIVNNTTATKTLTATAEAPFWFKDGESCVSTKSVVVPGNSCGSVTVQFTATTLGDYSGIITFQNSSLDGGQCVIPVHARAITNNSNHDWVDLGLPSGTLWATCNVGANSPEEYGDYFAWGETEPKEVYDLNTYKWCLGNDATITKYCTKSSYGNNGFTDGKTELDPEDDAAYVNWGPLWRMPSRAQQIELFEQCTHTGTTHNGVNGQLFIGPNGNSIFIPTAGIRWDDSLSSVGENGYYWSRTLWADAPHYAYNLGVARSGAFLDFFHRTNGFPVRAVRVPEEKHEYVDLGLPSGTLWATCNVGASKPEEYGDYFAWGETEPKEVYDWSTYKWCNGSENTLTKYCTHSSLGIVDNKTELELEDDAAYVNWGPSWRMPNTEQQDELVEQCTWTWAQQNGVNGQLVTGPNGNTIFLPFSGYCSESLNFADSYGYYWSRTLDLEYGCQACYLNLWPDHVNWSSGVYRRYGFSVRAVRVSQN